MTKLGRISLILALCLTSGCQLLMLGGYLGAGVVAKKKAQKDLDKKTQATIKNPAITGKVAPGTIILSKANVAAKYNVPEQSLDSVMEITNYNQKRICFALTNRDLVGNGQVPDKSLSTDDWTPSFKVDGKTTATGVVVKRQANQEVNPISARWPFRVPSGWETKCKWSDCRDGATETRRTYSTEWRDTMVKHVQAASSFCVDNHQLPKTARNMTLTLESASTSTTYNYKWNLVP